MKFGGRFKPYLKIRRRAHALQHHDIDIKKLEGKLGRAGSHTWRAGLECHAHNSPDTAWASSLGEAVVDRHDQLGQCRPGVLTHCQLCCARMVLLTMCNRPVLPASDDAADDANALTGLLQLVTCSTCASR